MSELFGWFDFEDVYRDAVARAEDGARFVETGTFFGKSAHYLGTLIAGSGKTIHFDTWDSWAGVPPSYGYPGWQGTIPLTEERARLHLAGLPVHVRTGDALEAARCYADASLDFVMLDDDHGEAHVYAECGAWWPKIKPGGILCGHDYDWQTVCAGVTRWATEQGIAVQRVSFRCWRVDKPCAS